MEDNLIKKVTSINLMNMPDGLRLTFTYSTLNERGETVESNAKGSFVVNDEDMISAAERMFDAAASRIKQNV